MMKHLIKIFLITALLSAGCHHRAVVVGQEGDGSVVWDQGSSPRWDVGVPDRRLPPDRMQPPPDARGPASPPYILILTEGKGLYRYMPLSRTFVKLAQVGCPVSPQQQPNSMAVDHHGVSWLNYHPAYAADRVLFKVNAKITSCTHTAFSAAKTNFTAFGMAFVPDGPAGNTEKLYIVGHSAQKNPYQLAVVDTQKLTVKVIGKIDYYTPSPELTGTPNGELYAYYPGTVNEMVVQLDKQTGKKLKVWKLAGLPTVNNSFHFVYWRGHFYIFTSTYQNSWVKRLDPTTGKVEHQLTNLKLYVVGAGVPYHMR